jgi:hypothetical protein
MDLQIERELFYIGAVVLWLLGVVLVVAWKVRTS